MNKIIIEKNKVKRKIFQKRIIMFLTNFNESIFTPYTNYSHRKIVIDYLYVNSLLTDEMYKNISYFILENIKDKELFKLGINICNNIIKNNFKIKRFPKGRIKVERISVVD